MRIELTTEELGLLSTGTTLTFAEGTDVVKFSAEDLSISVRRMVEGETAKVGENIEVSYN
jgi:hypothetical protein